jgi:hypothetical protein
MMSGSPLAHWAMAMPNLYQGSNIDSTILQYALNVADIRRVDIKDLKAIESIFSKVTVQLKDLYNRQNFRPSLFARNTL